jgi:hypothetical protein
VVGRTVTVYAGDTEVEMVPPEIFPDRENEPWLIPTGDSEGTQGLLMPPASPSDLSGDYYEPDWTKNELWGGNYSILPTPYAKTNHPADGTGKHWPDVQIYSEQRGDFEAEWRPDGRVQLLYAKAEDDGSAPALPQSGQTWADTEWKVAEASATDMDDKGLPGNPDWKVTNWVTGDAESGMADGKYYVAVAATDDIGHTTGIPVGQTDPVMPDMVEIWIDNTGPSATLTASELGSDGSLTAITGGTMERGQPLALSINDEPMAVADMDKVTFMWKAKHDYDWETVQVLVQADANLQLPAGVQLPAGAHYYEFQDHEATTQPYSVTLQPWYFREDVAEVLQVVDPNTGNIIEVLVVWGEVAWMNWSGISLAPQNLALGNVYQFKAVAEDHTGNKADTNVIELVVVDKEAEAAIP